MFLMMIFSTTLELMVVNRNSGLTLSKPSRSAIRLVPKLSENDPSLISVALKNSASLLLLPLPRPPPPLPNPVRIDSRVVYLFC